MRILIESVVLRMPETKDVPLLYQYKNDPEVSRLLGGFSRGYSHQDLEDWVQYHRKRNDEALWVIAAADSDLCLGHVGLYQIDHRVRSAEFAILLGEKSYWGKGLGTKVTRKVLEHGFSMLNLNRIHLTVLQNNPRAIALYKRLGFMQEGVMRQAQFKDGVYLDVIVMGLLLEDWRRAS